MEIQVINGKEYVYCKEHDIWYPKTLHDEVEQRREKERKRECAPDISLDILSCPLCVKDLVNVFRSIHIPEERSNIPRILRYRAPRPKKSKEG